MSVPLLEPNYIGTMRSLEAQARENEKNRAAQARENNKQFGFDIGKALLAGGLNMGADALSKHLDLPLELAKGGGYGPDDTPAPDVTPTTPAVDDAVRGAALSVLADKVKAPPVETAPSPQPAPVTPPKPFSLTPPSAIQPETPDAQNPTFAKGLPTEETPVTKAWDNLAPRPTVASEPAAAALPPSTGTPPEGSGISAKFKQLAADRTPAPQPEPISDTEAALRRMSKLNRRASTSESALREAQADALRAKPSGDPMAAEKLRKLKLESAKLEADAKSAAAAYEPGTPQYESRRTKAWDDAFQAVSRTEPRSSGASGLLSSSGGATRPRAVGAVVDDGTGWPRTLFPDAQGRFLYHSADGSTTDYQVTYDKQLQAYRAVSAVRTDQDARGRAVKTRVEVRPSPVPGAGGGASTQPGSTTKSTPPAATAPTSLADRISALGLPPTATPQQIRDLGSDTQLALLPPSERIARRNEANAAALEAQRLVDEAKAAAVKAGGSSNTAAHQSAYQSAVSELQGIGPKESAAVQGRIRTTDELFPLINGRYREGGGSLNAASLAEAKAGHPYTPVGDEETDAARRPLYEKVRQTYAAARQEGGADFSRQKVAAAKKAMLGYFQAHPAEQGVSLSKMLGDWGVSLSDSERREVLRALQPDQPKLAPGPAESSPGQLPPPPKVATPAAPAPKSKADDLFDRINAQPWSKEKKRRVFLATAQRDGLK